MKSVLVILLFVFASLGLKAQSYETAIGVRAEFISGLSIKQFASETKAYEIIAGFSQGGFLITGLVEYHRPIGEETNLNWFFGGGISMGLWTNATEGNPWGTRSTSVASLTPIVGLDYKFPNYPFNLSLDYRPYLNLIGDINFYGLNGGLSVRYTF